MRVILHNSSKIEVVARAIRKCWKSEYRMDTSGDLVGENDAKLIKTVIKRGHTSTLEHASYTFEIDGVSRALLQEMARHRIASLSVESTRYCLKRILSEDGGNLRDHLVQTGVEAVDQIADSSLLALAELMKTNPELRNDQLKYAIPEALKTSFFLTINARSLRNLLTLRIAPEALQEFRELCKAILLAIPASHREAFFEDIAERAFYGHC